MSDDIEYNKASGTVMVPIKTSWIITIVVFIVGNLTGGFGSTALTTTSEASGARTQVENLGDAVLAKIDEVNKVNQEYVDSAEGRIMARLDTLAALLQDKIEFNERSIINLDGYFKGFVESQRAPSQNGTNQ